MKQKLKDALNPSATFNFRNISGKDVMLCLLPGIYDTKRIVTLGFSTGNLRVDTTSENIHYVENPGDETSKEKVFLTEAKLSGDMPKIGTVLYREDNPANLVNAGYPCSQVADDYDGCIDSEAMPVVVNGASRARYRDFRNSVARLGLRVQKIVIQNKTNPSDESLFDQEIEVSRTAIGAKGATRFIKLQNYIEPKNFDRSKIEIEFTDDAPLDLTPDAYMAMRIPGNAEFSMQFIFDA